MINSMYMEAGATMKGDGVCSSIATHLEVAI